MAANTPTLTQAMLDDLHIGNASLSLLAYNPALTTLSGLDFSNADQIFTLEGSFNLNADDPSGTDIRIDQHKQVIDTDIEKGGNWRMTGNIPSIAQALMEYFFTDCPAVTGVKGADGTTTYAGKAFLATPEVIECTILAESESKNTAILFPHVKLVVSPVKKDDNTNPAYLSFVGFILPNAMKNEGALVGDFAVLKAAA